MDSQDSGNEKINRDFGQWAGIAFALVGGFLALTFAHPLHAQKVVFSAPGNNFGVWRLTHDPHIRDWSIQQIHKRVLQHIKTLSE